jgi:hypothetical protein
MTSSRQNNFMNEFLYQIKFLFRTTCM